MCLTEPHAGTDLGIIKTKAERNEDGTYSITGTKIFITGGDHDLAENIIHLVLAKHLMHLPALVVFPCSSYRSSWSMKMVQLANVTRLAQVQSNTKWGSRHLQLA